MTEHVLITGANRGIGLALCQRYCDRQDRVTAVCREASPELRELPVNIIGGVDVRAGTGVDRLVTELEETPIDLLINNAGILHSDRWPDLDFESIEEQFRVNALGPLRVTHGLRNLLRDGSRICIMTSRMGSIGDNTSGGYYGYRMSKSAVNMAGMSLHHDLSGRGISVLMLHPGPVATEMTDHQGADVDAVAARIVERLDELGQDKSGTFVHVENYPLPW